MLNSGDFAIVVDKKYAIVHHCAHCNCFYHQRNVTRWQQQQQKKKYFFFMLLLFLLLHNVICISAEKNREKKK